MTSLCNLEDLRIIIYYYFITINLIINDKNSFNYDYNRLIT